VYNDFGLSHREPIDEETLNMPNKTDVARRLAETHYQVEAGITQIFQIVGRPEAELRPEEPIKLLEVNQFSIPSGVMPLYFDAAPARGIHFPSVIVEVTPEEFTKIRSQELKLPEGWTLGDLFPKSDGDERP
jgi:hypothetical protein